MSPSLSPTYPRNRNLFRALGALFLCAIEEEIVKQKLKRTDVIRHLDRAAYLGQGQTDASANWNQWKKGTGGKGCFASADSKVAAKLVEAAYNLNLCHWEDGEPSPGIANSRQARLDLVDAFDFLGKGYWTESEPELTVAEIDGLIYRMGRIDFTDSNNIFLDLVTKEKITVSKYSRVLLDSSSHSKRRQTIEAALRAHYAMGKLMRDMQNGTSFSALEGAIPHNRRLQSKTRGLLLNEVEARLQEDLDGLIATAVYLCGELYNSKAHSCEVASGLLRDLAAQLLKKCRDGDIY